MNLKCAHHVYYYLFMQRLSLSAVTMSLARPRHAVLSGVNEHNSFIHLKILAPQKSTAYCCFTASTSAGWQRGRLLFKIETEPHIKSPVRQNMCNITCMFHEVSDKTFGVGTTYPCYVVYAFTSIYSILNLVQRLWFSLFLCLYQDMFMG